MKPKFFYAMLFAALVAFALCGHGMTSKQAVDAVLANVTNTPTSSSNAVVDAQATNVASIAVQGSDIVAAGAYTRPSIAVNGATMAIASEGSGEGSVHLWVAKDGKWVGGEVVRGSLQTAKRTYVPDTAIDNAGYVYASFRYGPKTGGVWQGPGLVIRSPSGVIKTFYPQITTGAARIHAQDSGVILASKNGGYGVINNQGVVTKRSTYKCTATGEKFDFEVLRGTVAIAVNGYSKELSAVSVDGKITTCFAYTTAQGNDLNYPSVAIHSSGVWMASVNDSQLRVQCVLPNGKTRWAIGQTPTLGDATLTDRCPPRLIVYKGRLLAFWTFKGSVYRVDVENRLKGVSKPSWVIKGSMPDLAVDSAGTLHMAYVDGGIRHTTLK